MTSQVATDILGRELCPACQMPLPSDSVAKEIHMIRHILEGIQEILDMLAYDIKAIRHTGLPGKDKKW